ncbi:MAG TPA: hypothetical protein VF258_00565 [Luteolibacter sp.]
MSAVSTMCQCCGEDSGKLARFDKVLGTICADCDEGVRISRPFLEKQRVCEIFTGPCGDNSAGEVRK